MTAGDLPDAFSRRVEASRSSDREKSRLLREEEAEQVARQTQLDADRRFLAQLAKAVAGRAALPAHSVKTNYLTQKVDEITVTSRLEAWEQTHKPTTGSWWQTSATRARNHASNRAAELRRLQASHLQEVRGWCLYVGKRSETSYGAGSHAKSLPEPYATEYFLGLVLTDTGEFLHVHRAEPALFTEDQVRELKSLAPGQCDDTVLFESPGLRVSLADAEAALALFVKDFELDGSGPQAPA